MRLRNHINVESAIDKVMYYYDGIINK